MAHGGIHGPQIDPFGTIWLLPSAEACHIGPNQVVRRVARHLCHDQARATSCSSNVSTMSPTLMSLYPPSVRPHS